MQISNIYNDEEILKELGSRIKAERIRQNLTQEQLAINSGVGKRTVERAESGESIQFLNLLKLLRTLHQLSAVDLLLPSAEMTPMQYLYSKTQKQPQRYYPVTEKKTEYGKTNNKKGFVWEEDK